MKKYADIVYLLAYLGLGGICIANIFVESEVLLREMLYLLGFNLGYLLRDSVSKEDK